MCTELYEYYLFVNLVVSLTKRALKTINFLEKNSQKNAETIPTFNGQWLKLTDLFPIRKNMN